MRWQHCIDHADKYSKAGRLTRLSSRRSSAADRQSVKRDYYCASRLFCQITIALTSNLERCSLQYKPTRLQSGTLETLMLTHYKMTLRLCVATYVHAQMIVKLMNWYMCLTPVSPIASTNMLHGVTCGYETQHHTPGMTLTSMSPGIKRENRRKCGEEQNWRLIDNYTSPPAINILR